MFIEWLYVYCTRPWRYCSKQDRQVLCSLGAYIVMTVNGVSKLENKITSGISVIWEQQNLDRVMWGNGMWEWLRGLLWSKWWAKSPLMRCDAWVETGITGRSQLVKISGPTMPGRGNKKCKGPTTNKFGVFENVEDKCALLRRERVVGRIWDQKKVEM